MSNTTAADAARSFLSAVWDGEPPDDATLAAAVDNLLASYHRTSETHPSEDDTEPPRDDWRLVSEEVASRFPAYGYYQVADPSDPPGEAASTGDAVDDLLDITSTMREVVWRADKLGMDDATWYFRLDYFHWGRHARELGLYLHSRQFT